MTVICADWHACDRRLIATNVSGLLHAVGAVLSVGARQVGAAC
jgi:hypothetical protein